MRRLLLVLLLALVGATALAVGSCGGGQPYEVRAIFDDASFVVSGEEVRVAGVKVGKIKSTSVTRERKAAVVMQITDPAFQDFRQDATCKIQPQSLIGEQFVNCTPTQPRSSSEQAPPALRQIDGGAGDGQYLLPVKQTSISVALDLVGDASRLPVRQRLSLILNELGVGLAGRGEDLNAVIRRSAPALQELDKVLKLVASQNQALQRLAVDSDTIMEPLAARRRNVTGALRQAQRVAQATAERREALAAGLQRLPTFLQETTPTMRRISALADQLTPVASDLRRQAPAINAVISRTGPFARAATPALESLGDAAKPGIPAIRAALPITKDLNQFAQEARPVLNTAAKVLVSLRKTDTIERLLDFVYYSALSVNGFDSVSHFLRAGLLVNTCSTYAVNPALVCASKFSGKSGAPAGSVSSGSDVVLQRTAAVLAGADPKEVLADPRYGATPTGADGSADDEDKGRTGTKTSATPSKAAGAAASQSTGAATSTSDATATSAGTDQAAQGAATGANEAAQAGMLDYLFGEDGQ